MNAKQIKEKIKIEYFFKKENFKPTKYNSKTGVLYYISPFRPNEKKPSFKVDSIKKVWYDHGRGSGGSIIDFVMEFKGLDFKNTIAYFNENYREITEDFRIELENISEVSTSTGKINIIEVKDLSHIKLLNYLEDRKINLDIAKRYCKEVYFKLNGKEIYAIGFKNNSNSFELRNKYFKGSDGIKKDITLIKNKLNAKKLKKFEGFIDFLSYLTDFPEEEKEFDYLILNTCSFLKKINPQKKCYQINKEIEKEQLFKIINSYQEVDSYLDNDLTGKECLEILKEIHPLVIDKSYIYEGFIDYNSFLMDRNK